MAWGNFGTFNKFEFDILCQITNLCNIGFFLIYARVGGGKKKACSCTGKMIR